MLRVCRLHRERPGWEGLAVLLCIGVLACWILGSRPPEFDPVLSRESLTDPGFGEGGTHIIPKGRRSFERLAQSYHSLQQPQSGLRLLLASHNRLFWYSVDRDEVEVVHEGRGVYYGVFPHEDHHATSAWVVSRPHNWHPATTEEYLLHIDLASGQLLDEKRLPSRFSHDAVRHGSSAWVCSTGTGALLHLDFPSMRLRRSYDLFTAREHINTIAVLDDTSVWLVLHNLGNSRVVQVDVQTGARLQTFENVGLNSHGLVAWRERLVLLSSKETALITLDPRTQAVEYVWRGDSGFLKGLVVVDDVAYFGLSPPMERQGRDGPNVNCELVAVSLLRGTLVFRKPLPTHGLLNIVAAPHLEEGSTYRAVFSAGRAPATGAHDGGAVHTVRTDPLVVGARAREDLTKPRGGGAVAVDIAATGGDVNVEEQPADEADDELAWGETWLANPVNMDNIGGMWSTRMPFMEIGRKGATRSNKPSAIYAHLGHVPEGLLKPLKEKLRTMPQDWWDPEVQKTVSAYIANREQNLAAIKPGVHTMFLRFSTRNADHVWQLPLYDYFKDAVEPLLEATIGRDALKGILRLQLAQMTPGAHIKPHKDTGPWAMKTHRIHFVLKTSKEVSFVSCPNCRGGAAGGAWSASPECQPPPQGTCVPIDATPDSVFEVDNLVLHEVKNPSKEDRVHLVVDVFEPGVVAPEPVVLKPGQECPYVPSAALAHQSGC